MFAKSTPAGLVSLLALAVAATALGGCAESVGSEPATVHSAAYVALPKTIEAKPTARQDVPAARAETRQIASAGPVSNAHRRDDCGR